jgi:hypothetical protein
MTTTEDTSAINMFLNSNFIGSDNTIATAIPPFSPPRIRIFF